MEFGIDFQDLFCKQVLYGSLLGLILVAWFWGIARRDSDDWKPENRLKWKNNIRIAVGIVFLLVALALFLTFIVNWINADTNLALHTRYVWFDSAYSKMKFIHAFYVGIVVSMLLAFTFLSLGVYTLRFRPSPRSIWIKIRKCIAYYAVFAVYVSFILVSFENLYVSNYLPIDSTGMIFGIVLALVIEILIIWLLLRHYNNERYISYKNYTVVVEIKERDMSDSMQIPSEEKRPFMDIIGNKKRMLAYYVGYETILFAFFLIEILIILSDDGPIGVPVVLFLGLSVLPIGVYWMLRLYKESKQ